MPGRTKGHPVGNEVGAESICYLAQGVDLAKKGNGRFGQSGRGRPDQSPRFSLALCRPGALKRAQKRIERPAKAEVEG